MYMERDCCQFVPFSNFKNTPGALAREVLKEIPDQITQYFRNKGIAPNQKVEGTSSSQQDEFYKCK
jgi:hypothetical protein